MTNTQKTDLSTINLDESSGLTLEEALATAIKKLLLHPKKLKTRNSIIFSTDGFWFTLDEFVTYIESMRQDLVNLLKALPPDARVSFIHQQENLIIECSLQNGIVCISDPQRLNC